MILRWLHVVVATLSLVAGATEASADVDTALVVSIDVSNSVDEHRYQLQLQGIAQALEDRTVTDAILSGAHGGILLSLVTWADRPQTAVPWVRIRSCEDALALAQRIRQLPRLSGEFTCVSRMLRYVSDKMVTQIPEPATRVIVDVSGDGTDNCNPDELASAVRDELATSGVTVNGLPILEGDESDMLESWYRDNVIAGPGAFLMPANGFEDFGRAIRQKFVVEVSEAARSFKPDTMGN